MMSFIILINIFYILPLSPFLSERRSLVSAKLSWIFESANIIVKLIIVTVIAKIIANRKIKIENY